MKEYDNFKKQGTAGVGVAIAWATEQGFTVSIPIVDSQKYDLIFDMYGELKKIQVKTSHRVVKSGAFEIELRTTGGNKSRNTYKPFNPDEIDYLFIYAGNGDKYFIPSQFVNNANSMKVGGLKWLEFKIN